MNSTALSSRPISVSDDIFIVLQGSQNDIVIERPMFMPDATSGGFLLDFCLYRYKIKPFIHHFLPLIAVVCPSLTPSVDSGINRLLTVPFCAHNTPFLHARNIDRFQRLLYRSFHCFVKEIENIFAIYFPSQRYLSSLIPFGIFLV